MCGGIRAFYGRDTLIQIILERQPLSFSDAIIFVLWGHLWEKNKMGLEGIWYLCKHRKLIL